MFRDLGPAPCLACQRALNKYIIGCVKCSLRRAREMEKYHKGTRDSLPPPSIPRAHND